MPQGDKKMGTIEPAEEGITRRLQEAIDRLQDDVKRVEIWAGALSGFLQPVPEYDGSPRGNLLPRREERPRMPSRKRPQAAASTLAKRA
jgi:hypothetical protein